MAALAGSTTGSSQSVAPGAQSLSIIRPAIDVLFMAASAHAHGGQLEQLLATNEHAALASDPTSWTIMTPILVVPLVVLTDQGAYAWMPRTKATYRDLTATEWAAFAASVSDPAAFWDFVCAHRDDATARFAVLDGFARMMYLNTRYSSVPSTASLPIATTVVSPGHLFHLQRLSTLSNIAARVVRPFTGFECIEAGCKPWQAFVESTTVSVRLAVCQQFTAAYATQLDAADLRTLTTLFTERECIPFESTTYYFRLVHDTTGSQRARRFAMVRLFLKFLLGGALSDGDEPASLDESDRASSFTMEAILRLHPRARLFMLHSRQQHGSVASCFTGSKALTKTYLGQNAVTTRAFWRGDRFDVSVGTWCPMAQICFFRYLYVQYQLLQCHTPAATNTPATRAGAPCHWPTPMAFDPLDWQSSFEALGRVEDLVSTCPALASILNDAPISPTAVHSRLIRYMTTMSMRLRQIDALLALYARVDHTLTDLRHAIATQLSLVINYDAHPLNDATPPLLDEFPCVAAIVEALSSVPGFAHHVPSFGALAAKAAIQRCQARGPVRVRFSPGATVNLANPSLPRVTSTAVHLVTTDALPQGSCIFSTQIVPLQRRLGRGGAGTSPPEGTLRILAQDHTTVLAVCDPSCWANCLAQPPAGVVPNCHVSANGHAVLASRSLRGNETLYLDTTPATGAHVEVPAAAVPPPGPMLSPFEELVPQVNHLQRGWAVSVLPEDAVRISPDQQHRAFPMANDFPPILYQTYQVVNQIRAAVSDNTWKMPVQQHKAVVKHIIVIGGAGHQVFFHKVLRDAVIKYGTADQRLWLQAFIATRDIARREFIRHHESKFNGRSTTALQAMPSSVLISKHNQHWHLDHFSNAGFAVQSLTHGDFHPEATWVADIPDEILTHLYKIIPQLVCLTPEELLCYLVRFANSDGSLKTPFDASHALNEIAALLLGDDFLHQYTVSCIARVLDGARSYFKFGEFFTAYNAVHLIIVYCFFFPYYQSLLLLGNEKALLLTIEMRQSAIAICLVHSHQ
jgi:hypothetical protein